MALFTTSAEHIPACRIKAARERGVHRKLLFCVGGGLGDQMSAEPALSYALRTYQNVHMSLLAPHPELFTHLPFDEVFTFDGKGTQISEPEKGGNRFPQPNRLDYLLIHTFLYKFQIGLQFLDPNGMNTVDFCCMTALRQLLPHCEREIHLTPSPMNPGLYTPAERDVIVHPGKSWPSRTFPTHWWDGVLTWLKVSGCRPILIGQKNMTLPVNTSGCLDLRDSTNVNEYIWICQQAKVVLTNDSSPVHAASSSDPDHYEDSGKAYIGFLATARRPEHVMNWRCGELGWRMQNFARGGLWDYYDYCPNNGEGYNLTEADASWIHDWLPPPREFAEWAAERIEQPGNGIAH